MEELDYLERPPDLPDAEDQPPQTQEEKKEEVKKKKKTKLHRLRPEMVTDPQKGVLFLYETMQKHEFRGDETQELDKLMHLIEEWHYLLMPKYDFNYFCDRLQKFGSNNAVKSQLQMLRKAHKGLIPWNYIKDPLGLAPQQQLQQGQDPPRQNANSSEPLIDLDELIKMNEALAQGKQAQGDSREVEITDDKSQLYTNKKKPIMVKSRSALKGPSQNPPGGMQPAQVSLPASTQPPQTSRPTDTQPLQPQQALPQIPEERQQREVKEGQDFDFWAEIEEAFKLREQKKLFPS